MAWTMSAREVVRDSLGLLGVVGAADEVSGEDFDLGLRTLNGLLQSLPLDGYAWPNLSLVGSAVSWSIGTPSYVTAPADYLSDLQLSRTDANGNQIPLGAITRADWVQLPNKSATGAPSSFYEEVNGRIYLWPVPTSDPGLRASYIAKPDDAVFNTQPDIPASWLLGLQWGLAAHLAPHFQKDPTTYLQVWMVKRAEMLANGVSTAPVVFELID